MDVQPEHLTIGGAVTGAVGAWFGSKAIWRRDRSAGAKADVGMTESHRLQAELEYSTKLAAEMRLLSDKVAGLQSSVLAIGTMLEAMVLCESCRTLNAPFIRTITSQVDYHVPRDKTPQGADKRQDMETRGLVDAFLETRGYK